jgi:hypothetical protein
MENTKPKTSYNNIPNGIVVVETESVLNNVIVRELQSANLKLSIFHAIQIAAGAKKYIDNIKELVIPKTVLNIYIMLTDGIISGNPEIEVKLTRQEIMVMLNFLKHRMQHCEEERDAGSERFHSDTYIGQKLLLIDLKELLLGEIVDFAETVN